MKALFLAISMLAAGFLVATPASAKTLAYPGPSNASFVIDHPGDWEVVPGDEVGDYVTLNSPTGAVLQLRTVEGSKEALDGLIQENIDYLKETFSNVELGEPKEFKQDGMTGSVLVGSGTDTDDQETGFAMYFIALPDGNIADIWYAVVKGDETGHTAAVQILNSFRSP